MHGSQPRPERYSLGVALKIDTVRSCTGTQEEAAGENDQ